MLEIVRVSLKGIFRDRIFQGIMALALLMLFIPSVAELSMRQVTELAITLSLSLISLILLLLAIFLGATSIWKDIERRYTYSVLSLPLSRGSYLAGRFLAIALFLLLTTVVLGLMACLVIQLAGGSYPQERPLVWNYILAALFFDLLKYILVAAVALFFSSLGTSFFLPIFCSLAIFFAGTVSQEVYDYLHSAAAEKSVPPLVRQFAEPLYYLLPNLSGFDLKVNAIYAIAPDVNGLLLTFGYFLTYAGILVAAASLILERREMR